MNTEDKTRLRRAILDSGDARRRPGLDDIRQRLVKKGEWKRLELRNCMGRFGDAVRWKPRRDPAAERFNRRRQQRIQSKPFSRFYETVKFKGGAKREPSQYHALRARLLERKYGARPRDSSLNLAIKSRKTLGGALDGQLISLRRHRPQPKRPPSKYPSRAWQIVARENRRRKQKFMSKKSRQRAEKITGMATNHQGFRPNATQRAIARYRSMSPKLRSRFNKLGEKRGLSKLYISPSRGSHGLRLLQMSTSYQGDSPIEDGPRLKRLALAGIAAGGIYKGASGIKKGQPGIAHKRPSVMRTIPGVGGGSYKQRSASFASWLTKQRKVSERRRASGKPHPDYNPKNDPKHGVPFGKRGQTWGNPMPTKKQRPEIYSKNLGRDLTSKKFIHSPGPDRKPTRPVAAANRMPPRDRTYPKFGTLRPHEHKRGVLVGPGSRPAHYAKYGPGNKVSVHKHKSPPPKAIPKGRRGANWGGLR